MQSPAPCECSSCSCGFVAGCSGTGELSESLRVFWADLLPELVSLPQTVPCQLILASCGLCLERVERDFICVFIFIFLKTCRIWCQNVFPWRGPGAGKRSWGARGIPVPESLCSLSPLCPTRDLTSLASSSYFGAPGQMSQVAAEQVNKDVVKQKGLPCCESSAVRPASVSFLQPQALVETTPHPLINS